MEKTRDDEMETGIVQWSMRPRGLEFRVSLRGPTKWNSGEALGSYRLTTRCQSFVACLIEGCLLKM